MRWIALRDRVHRRTPKGTRQAGIKKKGIEKNSSAVSLLLAARALVERREELLRDFFCHAVDQA